jgi:D-3-phosphoglycerate dehydrogenase / 2-oxoglutarate reductase
MSVIFTTHPLHPTVMDDLCGLGELRVASEPTQAAIIAESHGVTVIIVRAPIAPEIIDREPGLRALVRHGAGLDMIPVDLATTAGVLVTNVPGANAGSVAEHVIWTALALLRRYPAVVADLRNTGWAAARAHADYNLELRGRKLAIVGMGNIGNALHRIAHLGFGMQVLAVTRREGALPDGAVAVSLREALQSCDVLALCCPLTPETQGLIGPAELALMQPHAVLINVARGPVVVETALVEALQTGVIAGAALDVFDTQPLPRDHPFMGLKNVILTPHVAGITDESMLRIGQAVVRQTAAILNGAKPEHFCNPQVWDAYRARF